MQSYLQGQKKNLAGKHELLQGFQNLVGLKKVP